MGSLVTDRTFLTPLILAILIVGASPRAALPQQAGAGKAPSQDEASGQPAPQAQAGAISSSNSVPDQLHRDAQRAGILTDFKKGLLEKTGFTFGLDYIPLLQQISDSPDHPTAAASGIFRFFGHWTPSKETSQDAGMVVFKLDHRHRLGTDITTQVLAPLAGVATTTGPVWNDKGFLLTNLYWTQGFGDNQFAYRIGVLDPTEYIDVARLMNVYEDVNDLAFSVSPTIPAPLQGLALLGRWSITPNYYLMGGLADANAEPDRPQDMFDNFGKGEYFTHISFGWVGSFAQRHTDNVNIVLWHQDDRGEAQVEGGWGAAFNLSRSLRGWEPYFKAAYSDSGGTFVDRSVSVGLGKRLGDRQDYAAVSVNWGRAPENERNQYLFEVFYRARLLPELAIGPHFHYFVNPANAPDKDSLWMLALKMRFVL